MAQARRRAVVRMFGPLGLEIAGSRLGPGDFGGVKPKQLLEILLLERGRTVSKDRLGDPLWGEHLPRRAAGQIPGARLVELPGVDHDPWVGDTEPVLAAVEEFVQTSASQGFSKVGARSSRERTTTTEVP